MVRYAARLSPSDLGSERGLTQIRLIEELHDKGLIQTVQLNLSHPATYGVAHDAAWEHLVKTGNRTGLNFILHGPGPGQGFNFTVSRGEDESWTRIRSNPVFGVETMDDYIAMMLKYCQGRLDMLSEAGLLGYPQGERPFVVYHPGTTHFICPDGNQDYKDFFNAKEPRTLNDYLRMMSTQFSGFDISLETVPPLQSDGLTVASHDRLQALTLFSTPELQRAVFAQKIRPLYRVRDLTHELAGFFQWRRYPNSFKAPYDNDDLIEAAIQYMTDLEEAIPPELTSGVIHDSGLPYKDHEFVPYDVHDELGNASVLTCDQQNNVALEGIVGNQLRRHFATHPDAVLVLELNYLRSLRQVENQIRYMRENIIKS